MMNKLINEQRNKEALNLAPTEAIMFPKEFICYSPWP
jgi:hypothetical protein